MRCRNHWPQSFAARALALGLLISLLNPVGLLAPQHAAAQAHSGSREAALALLRAGRFDEAERVFRQLAQRAPNSLEAAYDVARVAFAEENHAKARAACAPLKARAAQAPLTLVCNARAFLAMNRSGRAFELLETALEQAPDQHEAWLALGDAHRLRAATDESEAAYQRAAELAPETGDAWLGLGRLYLALGQPENARQALEKALATQPGWSEVQFELAKVSRGAEAVHWLEQATSERTRWPEAKLALGEARLALADHGGAQSAFEKALQLNPHLAAAHAGLGIVRHALGDLEAAERALRQAIELVPNNPRAALGLADVLAARQRVDEALEQYVAASHLDPRDPAPFVRAAGLARSQGRNVLAAGYLARALQRQPRLAKAHLLLGDILADRGAHDKAIEHYRRALDGEGPVELDDVRERLAALDGEGS